MRLPERAARNFVQRQVATSAMLRLNHSLWLWLRCEWEEANFVCGLKEGDIDPVGGGTVKLTPDHKRPHATDAPIDPRNPDDWQALCGRHQVMKKNYWDDTTGWLNVYAIVQAASEEEKRKVYEFLRKYFGDV